MKFRVVAAVAVVLLAGLLAVWMLCGDSYTDQPITLGEKKFITLYPKRVTIKDVTKAPGYCLGEPTVIKLEGLPEKYRGTKFTAMQYQPTYIERRIPPQTVEEISLAYPEDVMLAESSFSGRLILEASHVYEDCRQGYLDIIKELQKDISQYKSMNDVVNNPYYRRCLYQVRFPHKGKDCCIVVYDVIMRENTTYRPKIELYPLVNTDKGWQKAFPSWFDYDLFSALEEHLPQALLQQLPYENYYADPANPAVGWKF